MKKNDEEAGEMPIYSKRERNWYNSIPVERNPWEHFSAAVLKGNEIQCGTETLAKIPNIPGRISRRNVQKGNYVTHYIEFILERTYDPETRKARNKKVTIGTDISHIYNGMMVINERYHEFFDRDGNVIYRPGGENEPADEDADSEEDREENPEEETEMTDEDAGDTVMEDEGEMRKMAEGMTRREKDRAADAEKKRKMPGEDGETVEEMITNEEMQERMEQAQHERDRLEFLDSVLGLYKEEVEEQARKRPEAAMTAYQIRRINELLRELKEFFSRYDTESYLQLAEEAGEDRGNGGESGDDGDGSRPALTYTDMMIILAAYRCSLSSYRIGRLWKK